MAWLLTSCHSLRQGDLLFHVSAEDNAITSVTTGMIDHVAICLNSDSVIEAIGKGVVITPVDSVFAREDGYYLRGRVKGVRHRRSVQNARKYLGRPYDRLFLPDQNAIYCSELVQLSYVDRKGYPVFERIPMSFHDASGRITSYWTEYYRAYDMDVPEGKPGTNPGELSKRKNVRLNTKKRFR